LAPWWKTERLTFNKPGPPMTLRSVENCTRKIWQDALSTQSH
jgi:hypothetical protein